ncbi:MAG: histidinol-phosphate transaminase [Nitrospinaceae bacterium]
MSTVDLIQLVREKIKTLKSYQVENIDCEIKLHANESPYPPPEELLRDFQESVREFQLNRYPDPDCQTLKKTISRMIQVPPDHLVIGNGSDELIQLIMQVFCNEGDKILFPDPTFAMYSIIAKGLGLTPVPVPLNGRWDVNSGCILETLEGAPPRVVFISYPNNPTGNCYSEDEIRKVIEGFQGIVVLDEAYFNFSGKTFIKDLRKHNNLVILRSLSKIGLAGLRVGYGVADPVIIEQVNKVRLPYNSNTLSQAFAARLLENFSPVQKQIDTLTKERDRLLQALAEIKFVTVFPSDSNFILFRLEKEGGRIFRNLMENGILVRNLSSHPRLENCLRVTVGTREENDLFLTKLNLAGRKKEK